jgi:hypothetical protein
MECKLHTSGSRGSRVVMFRTSVRFSLGWQENSLQDCPLQHSFLSSRLVRCTHIRREDRHWPRCKSGPGDIPLLAVLPIWTPENGHPLRAKQDKGLCAPASRKSSCVAVLWVASGTQPVFLPCPGTCGLLAILHYLVRRSRAADFRGRASLVRMDIRVSLGAHDSASRSCTRACLCGNSPRYNHRRKRPQVTFHPPS